MTNKKSNVALGSALLMLAGVAHAQTAYVRPAYQFPAAPSQDGPAAVRVGESPVFFTPYLGVGAGRDDNLFLSNTNEKRSDFYVVSPGLALDARSPNSVLQFRHQSQIGRYTSSRDDDYVDHTTRAQYDVAFDRRNFLRVGLDYIRGHEPRGSTDRPSTGSPDKYRLTSPYITYAFGAPGAAGRAEVYYTGADRRYLNNRATTVGGDRENREFGGAFYWRIMPKTYVLAEARRTDISYRLPGSPLSAEERRYYGGVTWEPTAATTGTLKAGRLERRFDNREGGAEFNGTSWEGVVTWSPRTYSKFDFYTARQTNEATGLGSFILTSISGVAWTHAWSSFLSTGIDARFQKDEYQAFNRSDEIKALGLKVGYKFRRWLTIGAEYNHTQRDSNLPQFEYDKNLYLLTATASM